MKKIFLSLSAAALTVLSVFAQDFEGTLKYSIAMSGGGIEAQKAMLPTGYTFVIKGNNSKFITEGGMVSSMIGDVIYRGDEKTTYLVNNTTRTANKLEKTDSKEDKKSDLKVTKESGTAKILGYDCQKYKVVSKDPESGSEQIIYLWASKDLKLSASNKSESPVGGIGQFMFEGVDGFPLKMETITKIQGSEIKTIMTATKIDLSKVSESEVSIPKGYRIEEGLPEILKMMGNMK